YPPPFVFFALPFALMPAALAQEVWTDGLIAATLAAILLMPVPRMTRIAILFLAAMSWPLLFAIKLGQIGPVLLLLFVIGWRSLERPLPLGVSIAIGSIAKIQPIVLLGWTWLTRRRRASWIAVVVLAALSVAATIWAGPGAWVDELILLEKVTAAGAQYDVGV